MKVCRIIVASLLALPMYSPLLFAQDQCQQNFSIEGSFFSGKTYKTWATFDNVGSSKAFKKVYQYTVKDGWQISNADENLGIISASQSVSFGKGKTVPLNIVVEDFGKAGSKVSITYSTSGGVSSPEDAVQTHFCATLAEVSK
jgi:hypothetical protein